MRFLLLAFLSVLVSCGQNGSSSKSSSQGERDKPQLEEDYVSEIRQVDLLDVAMDVPVEVSGNSIIFKQSFSNSANGVRVTCDMAVNAGDAYEYQLKGNSLTIKTTNGERMTLKRVSGDGNSIVGSWSGSLKSGDMLILRRMTFVTENRLVMRTHCES